MVMLLFLASPFVQLNDLLVVSFFTSIGMPLVSAHVIKLTVSHSQPFFL